jgi:hypothetical protein
MAWCEANGVDFLFGLAKNDRSSPRSRVRSPGQASAILSGFAYWYCSLRAIRPTQCVSQLSPQSIVPRQILRFRSEIKSQDVISGSFARFRALALRAISSPTFFPSAALSNGATSFAAPNKATSRSTLCFGGKIPPRCGMGHHCIPKANVAKLARFPNLVRYRNGTMS